MLGVEYDEAAWAEIRNTSLGLFRLGVCRDEH